MIRDECTTQEYSCSCRHASASECDRPQRLLSLISQLKSPCLIRLVDGFEARWPVRGPWRGPITRWFSVFSFGATEAALDLHTPKNLEPRRMPNLSIIFVHSTIFTSFPVDQPRREWTMFLHLIHKLRAWGRVALCYIHSDSPLTSTYLDRPPKFPVDPLP